MVGGNAHWIDSAIDNGVSALFALACAYPALVLLDEFGGGRMAAASLVAILAFAVARRGLRRMAQGQIGKAHAFELVPLPQPIELDVLELNVPDPTKGLDQAVTDLRAAIAADPRVVPLFGPTETAGELAGRIDRHLQRPGPTSDDSAALADALRQLRGSLR